MNKWILRIASSVLAVLAFLTLLLNGIAFTQWFAGNIRLDSFPANGSLYETYGLSKQDIQNGIAQLPVEFQSPARGIMTNVEAFVHDMPNAIKDNGLSISELRLLLTQANGIVGNTGLVLKKAQSLLGNYYNSHAAVEEVYYYLGLNGVISRDEFVSTINMIESSSVRLNRYSWMINILCALTLLALIFSIICIFKRCRLQSVPLCIMMLVWLIAVCVIVDRVNANAWMIEYYILHMGAESGDILALTPWPFIGLALSVVSAVLGFAGARKAGKHRSAALDAGESDISSCVDSNPADGRCVKEEHRNEAIWRCRGCGKENAISKAYCPACGTARPAFNACPACGRALNEGAVFCPSCGRPVNR